MKLKTTWYTVIDCYNCSNNPGRMWCNALNR